MPNTDTPASRACLWCGELLADSRDSSIRCDACGRNNRREDLVTYHTLRPSARRLQMRIEVAAALVLAVCFFATVVNWQHLKGGDPRVSFSIIVPAVLAMGAGHRSRYITRRRVKSRWSAHPVSCGGLLLVVVGYWAVLGYSTVDLEGAALGAVLTLAAGVILFMAYRVWRASRSHT